MELDELLERVIDEESFLNFVRALAEDRASAVRAEKLKPSSPLGSDAGGWYNTTIESFLEAAVSWAEDTSFDSGQSAETENLWHKFAVFLYCGKIYE